MIVSILEGYLGYLSYGELMINDSVKTKTKILHYDNKGESKETIFNYPYEDELFTAHLDPLEFDWLRNLSLTMGVPSYRPIKWMDMQISGIVPGTDKNEVLDRTLNAHCTLTTLWPTDFSITRYDSDGTVIPISRY